MKKIFILLIYLYLSTFSFSQRNSNFDFSGITKFWEIADILKNNKQPSEQQWNELFKTPGYRVLLKWEFSRSFFKENFSLVFMPSQREALNRALKAGINRSHLRHYIKVRNNRTLINEQERKIKYSNYSQIAINRTLKFLPQNHVNQLPPVSFIIFESNGRGTSPIVVDLAATIEWNIVGFLAHEFHHWYRNRELKYRTYGIAAEDAPIINVLSRIEAEGIADQVDKIKWFTEASNSVSQYARTFINDVGKTPYVIQKMDNYLSAIAQDQSKKFLYSRKFQNLLPELGHTTGYFMSSLILQKFSRNDLVKCVGNPFRFIKLYDKAAKLSSGNYPGLSDKALEAINELERKYRK